MLRQLKKNHELTYLSLCPPGIDQKHLKAAAEFSQKQIWVPWKETPKGSAPFFGELLRNYCCTRLPYVIQKYRSSEMSRFIREIDSVRACDLIICDFLTPSINLFSENKRLNAPTLLFQHNVESMICTRLYEKAGNAAKRFYFRGQWQRMVAYEKRASEKCDGVVAVSDEDAKVFRQEFGLKNVLGAVPTGVDVSYFATKKESRKPRSLVFLGSMDWMPNIDAVNFFTAEIWPLVKKQFPETTFTIVGRNPPESVQQLAKTDDKIRVTGTVADVRPFVNGSEVMIVPLRVGGGTRIKIFEGMASAIPVISTRVGAEGLPVKDRENIFLADSPLEFSQAICEAFQKPELRDAIGKTGQNLVREQFGWEAVTKIFENYCLQVCSSKKDNN